MVGGRVLSEKHTHGSNMTMVGWVNTTYQPTEKTVSRWDVMSNIWRVARGGKCFWGVQEDGCARTGQKN